MFGAVLILGYHIFPISPFFLNEIPCTDSPANQSALSSVQITPQNGPIFASCKMP